MNIVPITQLPAPRLQLRWETLEGDPDYGLICHYELILPLRENDIRRGDDDRAEKTVAMSRTKCSGASPDVMAYTPPYRDGAHAQWDAEALGLPVYVVNGDSALRIEDALGLSCDDTASESKKETA